MGRAPPSARGSPSFVDLNPLDVMVHQRKTLGEGDSGDDTGDGQTTLDFLVRLAVEFEVRLARGVHRRPRRRLAIELEPAEILLRPDPRVELARDLLISLEEIRDARRGRT